MSSGDSSRRVRAREGSNPDRRIQNTEGRSGGAPGPHWILATCGGTRRCHNRLAVFEIASQTGCALTDADDARPGGFEPPTNGLEVRRSVL
jgi:hypothetical protein